MATATYPSDATLNALSFASTGVVTYTGDGSRVAYNLAEAIKFKGELIAQFDGIIQSSGGYTMSNSFNTVNFVAAPTTEQL